MNVLAFDIETVPDTEAGRRLLELEGLADADVARAMTHLRQQRTGSDFLPHYQHRIVAISVVLRTAEGLKVWSLGQTDSAEAELLGRFYDGLERYNPTLVSWNGSGFDLPVIHYRSLLHGVAAPRYWEVGEGDAGFRYNNYLNRFHWRHTDLMDVLSGYNPRGFAPLDELATMLGLPGKMGMSGKDVAERYLAGDLEGIRAYCETDVLNTFLIYLRFELMRGGLAPDAYTRECQSVRDALTAAERPHLQAFLERWQAG